MIPDTFYDRFEKVSTPAPDTRNPAGESVESLLAEQGEIPRPLDRTSHAFTQVLDGAQAFERAILTSTNPHELWNLWERLGPLVETLGRLELLALQKHGQLTEGEL